MKHRLVLLACVLGLVAVSCGTETGADGDGSATTTPPDPSVVLIDGEWLLTAADIDGSALQLLPDWDVTMLIDGTSIGGRAACNSYGGSLSSDGTSFSLGDVAMTEMGCEPQVHEVESAYIGALHRATTVARSGDTLTLTGDDVTLTFALIPPVDPAALVGTLWILDTIIEGEAASSTLAGADDATLVFNADGTFEGSTGCRNLAGMYIQDGAVVQFTDFGADGECPDDLQWQDNQVITVLESFRAEIDGNRLTLTAPGGEGLSYRTEG